MKPILLKMTALMCVILLIALLTACAKKADTGEANADHSATTDSIASVTEAPTAIATQPLIPNDTDPSTVKLIGTWDYKEISGYQYTFNEGGIGYYNSLGQVANFTYSADETTLIIVYEDTETPVELEYEIVGNSLNIKDPYDVITTYIRQ